MLGWQESTLKINILGLYDEFDNLVAVSWSNDDLYTYAITDFLANRSVFPNTVTYVSTGIFCFI